MELQHCNVKIFLSELTDSALEAYINVFHGWIQEQKTDELLIDVADYRHVPDGPAVILVGHEADYVVDRTDGRTGLLYNRKAPLEGLHRDRIRQALRATIRACQKLAGEPALSSSFAVRGDEFEFMVNDRLIAPNTPETFEAIAPEIRAVCDELFGAEGYTLIHDTDPRKRFTVRVRLSQPFEVAELAAKLV